MDNKIFGYNVKYTTNGNLQPYFKSVSARDTFMESCFVKQLNSTGLNINFLNGLKFNFVVNVDITQIEDINFVKVVYNEKEYYGYIVDFEMVSVNRTLIYVSRAPLYEIIDFHSYFSMFFCTRKTRLHPFVYTTYDNFIFENPCKMKCAEKIKTPHNMCYLLFLSPDIPLTATSSGAPYINVKTPFTYIDIKTNYLVYYIPASASSFNDRVLSALSPYLLGAYYFDLIFDINNVAHINKQPAELHITLDGTGVSLGFYLITKLTGGYIYDVSNDVSALSEFKIMCGVDQSITIPMHGFVSSNTKNNCRLEIHPIIDPNSCGYLINATSKSSDTLISQYKTDPVFLFQNSRMTYAMNANSVWASQNTYYNEVTSRHVKQIKDLAASEYDMLNYQNTNNLIGTIASTILGTAGGNFGRSGTGNMFGGANNAYQGLVGFFNSDKFASYIKETGEINSSASFDIRNLQAENDKNAPSGIGSYGNINSSRAYEDCQLTMFKMLPLTASYNSYKNYWHLYGNSCYCVETTPTYDIIDGHFSYVADGLFQNSRTNPINNMFAAYFQDILKKDFIYEVYE